MDSFNQEEGAGVLGVGTSNRTCLWLVKIDHMFLRILVRLKTGYICMLGHKNLLGKEIRFSTNFCSYLWNWTGPVYPCSERWRKAYGTLKKRLCCTTTQDLVLDRLYTSLCALNTSLCCLITSLCYKATFCKTQVCVTQVCVNIPQGFAQWRRVFFQMCCYGSCW